jgi:hypothetical protein
MPNWCSNSITITGSKSVIDKIEKIVREEEKSDIGFLQFMYPCPKELEDTTADGSKDKALMAKYGHSDWYSWKTDSWGTKWDVNEFYGVDRQGDTISFGFSSAWAPPLGAFEHFLSENDDCSIKAYYYEGGCDFAGVWEDGADECISPSDYKSDDEFWNDGLGFELDEMFNFTESMAEYEAEQEEANKEDVTEYVKGKAINIGEEA